MWCVVLCVPLLNLPILKLENGETGKRCSCSTYYMLSLIFPNFIFLFWNLSGKMKKWKTPKNKNQGNPDFKIPKKNERRPLKFKYDNPKEEETSVVPWYPSSVIPTTAVFSKKETVTQQKRFQVFNNINNNYYDKIYLESLLNGWLFSSINRIASV